MYERGLQSRRLWALDANGRRIRLPVDTWISHLAPGDRGLLARCAGPTLDVGCGAGLVAALAAGGVEALGIDVSGAAVTLTRLRGAQALRRSVFGAVPGAGTWQCALLADGNVGIGGDPAALLRRVASLLAAGGSVLVEVAGPGPVTSSTDVCLADDRGRVSDWFPWAEVGVDGIAAVAAAAGLAVAERWQDAGRWFALLRPHRHGARPAGR